LKDAQLKRVKAELRDAKIELAEDYDSDVDL
jgi:hypothetical protein